MKHLPRIFLSLGVAQILTACYGEFLDFNSNKVFGLVIAGIICLAVAIFSHGIIEDKF